MSFDFRKGLVGPVKSVTIYIAEFTRQNNEYREGPKMLSQAINFSPNQDSIEDITYSGDGTVHLREVFTVEADSTKSIIERFKANGQLRDRWLVTYDQDGKRTVAEGYDAGGKFLGRSVNHDDETSNAFTVNEPDISESVEREFDAFGNWIREIKFQKSTDGQVGMIPIIATYRTISYFQH